MTAILMGLTILFYGLGQILLKIGLLKLGPMSIDRLQSPSFIWQLVATPQIAAAVPIILVGTVFYLWLLSREPLTTIFPFLSLLFPFVMILGWLVLGEPVSWRMAIGVLILVFGLFVITTARSS